MKFFLEEMYMFLEEIYMFCGGNLYVFGGNIYAQKYVFFHNIIKNIFMIIKMPIV